MLVKKYTDKFKSNLFWNFLDAIGVHLVILIDHFLLRFFTGPEFHGLLNATLSIFYIASIYINLGLDYSLAPFYNFFSNNKKNAKKFFFENLFPQIIIIVFTALILSYFKFFIGITSSIDKKLILLMATTFILEGIRRTSKMLLQISLNAKSTFLIEFLSTILYLVIIWFSYALGFEINLYLCWSTLCFVTFLQAYFYAIKIYDLYQNLGTEQQSENLNYNYLDVLKSRLYAFIIQSVDQFFSIQFLIVLVAKGCFLLQDQSYCLSTAGFLKIASNISGWLAIIAYKAFGASGISVMANSNKIDFKNQVDIFHYVNNFFYKYLIFAFIFILINSNQLVLLITNNIYDASYYKILYLTLILGFIESLLIIYKRWYIVTQKSSFTALYEILSLFLTLITVVSLKYIYNIDFIFNILCSSIFSRFLLFLIIAYYSYFNFKIKPNDLFNYNLIIISIILSLVIKFLINLFI